MRIVSLNLDLDDASVVRRALEDALAACSCREGPSCPDCEALVALVSELDRVLTRSGGWTGARFVEAAASPPQRSVLAQAAPLSSAGVAPARRLWLVPGGPDG